MSLRNWILIASTIILGACAEEKLVDSRVEFGRAFQKVQKGMVSSEVLRILGKPEDIRTLRDPGGISWAGVKEVWSYGTNGHLTYPSRACIYIDDDATVKYFFGTDGAEDLVNKLGEAELTRLLRVISCVPGELNPRKIIQAVNELQPLGKKTGCAVLNEYLRISNPDDAWWAGSRLRDEFNMFILVRALFDVPANGPKRPSYPAIVGKGFLRPPALGAPDFNEPDDLALCPRFPLQIVDDVPVSLINGYSLSGVPERLRNHLHTLEKDASWRATPLTPPANPFSILKTLAGLKGWGAFQNRRLSDIVERQLRCMVDTVVPAPEDMDHAACIAVFEKNGTIWDSKIARYSFKDGTALPVPKRIIYFRTTFNPEIPKARIEAIVERQNPNEVEFILDCGFKSPRPQKFSVAIFAMNAGIRAKTPLARLLPTEFHDSESWSCSSSATANLPEGQSIQILCESDGKEQASELFKP